MPLQERKKLKNIKRIFEPYKNRKNFIRLDRNEDPIGWSSKFFKDWVNSISQYDLTAYSDSDALVKSISHWQKVKKDQIYITAGSDAAIKNIFEVFVEPNYKIILQEPSWRMYEVYSLIYGAKMIKINYDSNLNLDLKNLIKLINEEKPKIVVIANPNQPTGTIIKASIIEKIIQVSKENKCLIIIDEAYYLFTKQTSYKMIEKYNNLIIVRTFSKAFGLAGLRIGYCIANSKIIKKLKILRPVTDSNSLGLKAAEHSIKNINYNKLRIKLIIEGRNWLIKVLKKNNIETFESHTNFILLKCKNKKSALQIIKMTKQKGYLIKGPFDKYPLKNMIRISIGPINIMRKFWKDCNDIFTRVNIEL
tara:strand:+ start:50532 stop:51620 length:1089 start_codon:yes stop_codon:yes gene_type:complete